MLFPVSQLLQNKEPLLTIKRDSKVRDALSLMVKNDFSQLPIIDESGSLVSIITEESIAGTYFHTSGEVPILDLSVDNCQTRPVTLASDRDIFEALDLLENSYAIVIVDGKKPVGILTAYDATHFFRDLSEGLILIEDIEVTLRQYIEAILPEGNARDAALLRAFRPDKTDPTKPGKEYNELSFGNHIQLISTEQNWEKFAPYLEPREMFLALMRQVGQIRNQLAHFRGRMEPMQYDLLLRSRDWLSSRRRPAGAGVKEIQEKDIHVPRTRAGEGKYQPLQDWLQDQKEAGEARIGVAFEQIEEILQDPLPPSARSHRSWWANDYATHVQSAAWLNAGWLVDDADLEKGEVVFRQSVSALYPRFFTPMLDQLKERRPGWTQVSKAQTENWLSIAAGRTGFAFGWVLAREGAAQGVFRVELYIDVGDKIGNKKIFESLKSHEEEIQTKIGVPLNWERLEARRASRISTMIPFKMTTATPEETQEAQSWGVDTLLKFIDVLTPYIKSV